jgi:hypothetical protein
LAATKIGLRSLFARRGEALPPSWATFLPGAPSPDPSPALVGLTEYGHAILSAGFDVTSGWIWSQSREFVSATARARVELFGVSDSAALLLNLEGLATMAIA